MFLFFFTGCIGQTKDVFVSSDADASWMNAINANTVKDVLSKHCIKILPSDSILVGSAAISNYYASQEFRVNHISCLSSVFATNDSAYLYKINRVDADREYRQIIIWKKINSVWKVEFEYTLPFTCKKIDLSVMDAARNNWIRLCNLHNALQLVNSLYSKNAIYYNHKPLVLGRDSIAKEYSYMNHPSYHLKLNPVYLDVVNDRTIFEIGKGEGSYQGKYILIWKKNQADLWEIFIDSNI